MSSFAQDKPVPHVPPRPGIVKALGIANIVFAVFGAFSIMGSIVWVGMAIVQPKMRIEARVEVVTTPPPPPIAGTTGRPMIPFINPFTGMNDKMFIRFCAVDALTGVPITVLMLATGIGLINLKRWAARVWVVVSWLAILRIFLLGGYFILEVGPSFSETLSTAVIEMFRQQGMAPARIPPIQQFQRIYSIMFLIGGILMIVFGSIYPVLSIWLLGRPGPKAALVGSTSSMEAELS
jgi:hypothetical protein